MRTELCSNWRASLKIAKETSTRRDHFETKGETKCVYHLTSHLSVCSLGVRRRKPALGRTSHEHLGPGQALKPATVDAQQFMATKQCGRFVYKARKSSRTSFDPAWDRPCNITAIFPEFVRESTILISFQDNNGVPDRSVNGGRPLLAFRRTNLNPLYQAIFRTDQKDGSCPLWFGADAVLKTF